MAARELETWGTDYKPEEILMLNVHTDIVTLWAPNRAYRKLIRMIHLRCLGSGSAPVVTWCVRLVTPGLRSPAAPPAGEYWPLIGQYLSLLASDWSIGPDLDIVTSPWHLQESVCWPGHSSGADCENDKKCDQVNKEKCGVWLILMMMKINIDQCHIISCNICCHNSCPACDKRHAPAPEGECDVS